MARNAHALRWYVDPVVWEDLRRRLSGATLVFGLVAIVVIAAACSSDTGSGGPSDGGANDASADGGSCPNQRPSDGAPCSGSTRCEYGHTTCCGLEYSLFTCRCQAGSFSCFMTVECNFICPDAAAGD